MSEPKKGDFVNYKGVPLVIAEIEDDTFFCTDEDGKEYALVISDFD